MIITKVGRGGQITLPSEVRDQIGVREGDHVAFLIQGDQVLIQPLTGTLLDLRGSIPVSAPQDFDQIRREVLAAQAKRDASHGD